MSSALLDEWDVVVTDPLTGRTTGLAATSRRVFKALESAEVPYCVIGAAALAARGLSRMTRALDIDVLNENADAAIRALKEAKFRSGLPAGGSDESDAMMLFTDPRTGVEVDLLLAAGDPEAQAITNSSRTKLFGTSARVAELEDLLLLYLYSNQLRHLGDFGRIVKSGKVDLVKPERALFEMHPEMLATWRERLAAVQAPAPAPKKPVRRKR